MQSIHALSLTSDVNEWLANSHHPRILHIFDRVCNLINERSEVLSIVMPEIGNGPFNMVIDSHICFSDHLDLESLIAISNDQLYLGRLTIKTTATKFWNPRPDWEELHAKREEILNYSVSLREQWSSIRTNRPTDWEIVSPWRHGDASSQSALLAMTLPIANYQLRPNQFSNSLTSSFSAALVNADISSAQKITSQLAGLGAGLTPAGDDFIMGAIYATWIIHPIEIASILAQEIANRAAPLTTSLSGAWLKSAGKGKAGALWHEFFDSLISYNAIQLQITKLLSIGHTSGGDTLAGFLSVFISYAAIQFAIS